jgi:hypothetical protein
VTGFNLPPGVNANMIPGNRPEDDDEDAFWDLLDAEMQKTEEWDTIQGLLYGAVPDENRERAVATYVRLARDIGYKRGYQEGLADTGLALGGRGTT